MMVKKRSGRLEEVNLNKITKRVSILSQYPTLLQYVDPIVVSKKVVAGLYDGVTTAALDELAVETATHLSIQHYNYSYLAARIAVSNLHKVTCPKFSETVELLFAEHALSEELALVVKEHADRIDAEVDYDKDFVFDIFGFKTLEKSYLLRSSSGVAERPQDMYMRVALGIHGEDLDSAFSTYKMLSDGLFTHATPTLFNAGTRQPQMSSCFLLQMQADSIEGIFETAKQCALISKSAGGIGLSVHNIRATGTKISGTNGRSNGLVPMLQVFNNLARYVDQGGGKRKGAIAIYLEPWHPDIIDVLELRKPGGKEEMRARDLFFGLWTNDLFMQRVKNDEDWSLFCPHVCKGLDETHGKAFEQLYCAYEREGKAIRVIKAQLLFHKIIESQIESGTPYILFKDACNKKSNQQNLGAIKSSNLCTEIIEFTSPDEIAVCNLASIALPKFVGDDGRIDHEMLFDVVYKVTVNLNKIIDRNHYPIEEARRSNFRHRPIGIGVQGLADVFFKLRIAYDSKEAAELNSHIFETIYFAAMTCSVDLAQKDGAYETFAGSPLSKGFFQFDLWEEEARFPISARHDWESLRIRVVNHGARNSLLLAPMPTASTAQILGNVEAFEPQTSNIFVRRVLSGEFPVINRYLVDTLVAAGLWNHDTRQLIIANDGSVQCVEGLSDNDKAIFKNAWEMSMRTVVDLAADRGRFICQSASLNVFMAKPTVRKLSSYLFYAWEKGLKTGSYYIRARPAADAIKFTVDTSVVEKVGKKGKYNNMDDTERGGEAVCHSKSECLSCGA